jgi:LysM repeat protein
MARYRTGLYGRWRGRKRSRVRIIFVVVVVVAVIASVYGYHPFGKNENEATMTASGVNVEDTTNSAGPVPAESEPEPKIDLIEYVPEAASESNTEVDKLISDAQTLISAKPSRIMETRDKLNEALSMPMNGRQRAFVKRQLSELADKWLFSRTVFEQDRVCGSYKVKPGDRLRSIGSQFKVPYQILMRINNISRPKTLRAGETIKVINGPFHAKIYHSTFTMDLYLQDTFVRSYSVALGKPGMETPTGHWLVKPDGKLISPTWTDPVSGKTYEAENPDYPLGSRWIGLKGIEGAAKNRTGFAIHGTKDAGELGTARSRGCIRLYDEDVKFVYDLLTPGLSQIIVVE